MEDWGRLAKKPVGHTGDPRALRGTMDSWEEAAGGAGARVPPPLARPDRRESMDACGCRCVLPAASPERTQCFYQDVRSRCWDRSVPPSPTAWADAPWPCRRPLVVSDRSQGPGSRIHSTLGDRRAEWVQAWP